MRKTFPFLALLALFSCQKVIPPTSQLTPNPNHTATDKLPGGGTNPSSGGQYSGVSMETGYEQLSKHLVGGNWDGTYDFSWYNFTFNVSLTAYLLNGSMGDPCSFSFNDSPAFSEGAGYPSSVVGLGAGDAAFTFTYALTTLGSSTFYDDQYSSGDLANWATAVQSYWNYQNALRNYTPGSPLPPPVAPAYAPVGKVVALSGGNLIVTVYGKFIQIVPGPSDVAGVNFAVAELPWTPASDNYYCNTKCQFCAAHPTDPSCQAPGNP